MRLNDIVTLMFKIKNTDLKDINDK